MLLPVAKLPFSLIVIALVAMALLVLPVLVGKRDWFWSKGYRFLVAILAVVGGGYGAAQVGRNIMIVRNDAGDLATDSRTAIGDAMHDGIAIVRGTATGVVIVNATGGELELAEVCFGVPSFAKPIVIPARASYAADGATRPRWIGRKDGPPQQGPYGCSRWLHPAMR